ncbi:HU family DNA-binding protein [Tannerella forsythia]|uniref:DNA-binding protein n=1 Tax=Tannerella forsythia TaxID=28112 RepID=A0A3P1XKZ3_TANFO|nr:HU family DNA-binding protein [Tannerella forsythia]RRD59454.1 DNA-binding protein [Tannerella forsythia]RRD75961.1 DNA-binding protein [Tannerella forsythia]
MIEFEVKERIMSIGEKKGQTVYYAAPKTVQRITARQLEDEIVRATSLARGDVRNALTTLAEFVSSGLQQGASVDLGDLGAIKVVIGAQLMDTPQEVTAATLKTPAVRFFPKQEMLNAAKSVKVKVVNQYTGNESETP